MGGERTINLHGRPVPIPPATVHRYAAATILGLLSAAALMVAARRLAGALTHPLEPAALLAAGILVAGAAAAIRWGWFLPPTTSARRSLDRAVMLLT